MRPVNYCGCVMPNGKIKSICARDTEACDPANGNCIPVCNNANNVVARVPCACKISNRNVFVNVCTQRTLTCQ